MGDTERNRIKIGDRKQEGKEKNILEIPAKMLDLRYRHKDQHSCFQLALSEPAVTLSSNTLNSEMF